MPISKHTAPPGISSSARHTGISVMIGGAAGSVCRVLADEYFAEHFSRYPELFFHPAVSGIPFGILCINIIGCFALGLLQGTVQDRVCAAYALLGTGFLGGFTTFSTFAADTAQLWLRGDILAAASNTAATTLLCLAAAAAGYTCVGKQNELQ